MHDFPETNYSLIGRVQELGDEGSWSEFLAIYQPVVCRMARKRGLQDADALDTMQQVFVSVSKAIGLWKEDPAQPPFRAWLTIIARNAITKSLTRRPRDMGSGSTSVFEALQQIPEADETANELAVEARREAFRWAADQVRNEFSPDTWQIFWQTAIVGKSVSEVCQQTGRTPGAVYVARYRVLSRLKEKISEITQTWLL
jgi:RNA polymerase sigma-70 factor, ECF subfamily